jgi:FAR-17a/AIG1-like protein
VSFHVVPSVVMLVDLLLLSPPWTITVVPALALSSAIAFGYWFWIEKCFEHNQW